MTVSPPNQGFILSANSFDQQGQSLIQLWLATDAGPVKLEVSGEQTVFFIEQSQLDRAQQLLGGELARSANLPLKDFQQQPLAALYFHSLAAHKAAQLSLQQAGITCLEGDVKLHERFLYERFCYGSLLFQGQLRQQRGYTQISQAKVKAGDYQPQLRALSLDLECSRHGELYSAGLHGPGIAKVVMIGQPQPSECEIRWVSDERQLLLALCEEVQGFDPDLIIGWNVLNFDIRLLAKRAERMGIDLPLGRDGSKLRWREREQGQGGFATLAGRVVVDGIDALKNASYHFDSFSLEFVANQLLGRGKLVDDMEDRLGEIEHNFKHDKPQLAKYNLEDCKLVTEIFEHTHLQQFLVLRSQLTGLLLDRNGGSVAAFTNLYLPKLHRAGYIAPNLRGDFVADSPGGYVMDSRPGLYRHVLVLDFKSLYPSIIRTFKVDPLGLIEGLLEQDDAIEGFRGGFFSREQHFLPGIIETLWKQRDQAKKEQDQARSHAIKILMNSFYGVLGSTGCRFHDPRLASSITMRGHQLMRDTASWIEQQGYQVIYGDTDSTFVWLEGDLDNPQAQAIGSKLAVGINHYWQQRIQQEFALESQLEIEFETHFSDFLMPTIRGSETGSKKRYAGRTAKGELVIKGLETVRSDWTALAKHFQTVLLEKVFSGDDPSEFIRESIQQLQAGELDEQLIYHKRLRRRLSEYQKNVPPQVRAARIADEHNRKLGKPLQYQHKGRIAYLITLSGPEPLEYRQSQIDYQHYIDKQLKPIADAILPFIGKDFEQLSSAQIGLF
ncbi:DNA polymerase II [Aliagarivorans taiwanensis]|uniref:DNA polymerase II n=1 Tax=Aliagarivorans taiwanensis TaxID=561966 RepID=UPI000428F4C1|nr:DNA polymerase II [Aliagarivorans taiwanensis]